MHKYIIGKDAFSNGFWCATQRNFILVVKHFLNNGADVNYNPFKKRTSGDMPSALYNLVVGFTRAKSELIILLLQKGADPYPRNSKGQTITTLRGMAKLESYLGKSWEDLVREHKPMEHHDE
jgi:hypothetical protein